MADNCTGANNRSLRSTTRRQLLVGCLTCNGWRDDDGILMRLSVGTFELEGVKPRTVDARGSFLLSEWRGTIARHLLRCGLATC